MNQVHVGVPMTLLDESQAAELLGLKPNTMKIWRMKNEGPPYIKLTERCVRYNVIDVQKWLELRTVNTLREKAA